MLGSAEGRGLAMAVVPEAVAADPLAPVRLDRTAQRRRLVGNLGWLVAASRCYSCITNSGTRALQSVWHTNLPASKRRLFFPSTGAQLLSARHFRSNTDQDATAAFPGIRMYFKVCAPLAVGLHTMLLASSCALVHTEWCA
jgi:hypothetical protein